MHSLIDNLKAVVRFKENIINNTTFRLHYQVTTGFLLLCCILTTANQFFGDPIDCIVDEGVPQSIFNIYCWTHGTFTLPVYLTGNDQPYPGVGPVPTDPNLVRREGDGEEVRHAWYQWVAFVLFFQAILCYVPHFLWKSWEAGKLRSLLQNLDRNTLEDRSDAVQASVVLIAKYVFHRNSQHKIYVCKFIFCEFLNLVNIFGQMFLMDAFFGGQFSLYGLDVVFLFLNVGEERADPLARIFPKMTKCSFKHYGASGTIQINDGLCILPINFINEKIFVLIWFWFLALFILSSLHFSYRVITVLSKYVRYLILCGKCASSKSDVAAVVKELRYGEWFILMQLATYMDPIVFDDVIRQLRNRFDPFLSGGRGQGLSLKENEKSIYCDKLRNWIHVFADGISARLCRCKVSGKRLTSGCQSVLPGLFSNSAFDPEQSSTDTAPDLAGGQEGSVGGVGGDGWGQTAPIQSWNNTPSQLEQASGVSVPKNQQKKLISREKNSRKMSGWREKLLPRNMQGGGGSNILADQKRFGRDVIVSMLGPDHEQHQAQVRHNMSLNQGLSDMTEAELIEKEKKLIGRDSRKMPGWRERLLPRNLQGGGGSNIVADQDRFGRDVAISMPGQDHKQYQAQVGHNMSLNCQDLSDMAEAEHVDEEKKLFRRERDDQKMPDWRERLSPRNMQDGGGSKILADQDRFGKDAAISMPEQDHQQHQAQEGQNIFLHCQDLYDMAYAELVDEEKKLFRRERDDQKMPDWRERLSPKNMQGGGGSKILADQDRFGRDAAVLMPEQDHHQHQAQEGQNMSLHCKGLYDMAEGELVEADQGLEVPEGEDGGQFKPEPVPCWAGQGPHQAALAEPGC